MNNEIAKLNLEKFAHDSSSFYKTFCRIIEVAEKNNVLTFILTDDINSQYNYSEECRNGYSNLLFLQENYLIENQDIFLSFFNEILPNIIKLGNLKKWEADEIHSELFSVIFIFKDFVEKTNNHNIFNLDFYFDKKIIYLKES